MKLTLNTETLRAVLTVASTLARGRNALPILSGALIEPHDDDTMTLTVTNLQQAFTTTVPVLVDDPEPCILPLTNFMPLFNTISGTVTVTTEEKRFIVEFGTARYELPNYLLVEEYPPVPDTPETVAALPLSTLLELFQTVSYAASKEDARAVLKTVRLALENETITAVATDTHRLVFKTIPAGVPIARPHTLNIPTEAIQLLQRVAGLDKTEQCVIQTGKENAAFVIGTHHVFTQLITGQYPNWQRVVPTETRLTATVTRNELMTVLNRIRIVPKDTPKAYLNFAEQLTVSARGDSYLEATEIVPLIQSPTEPIEFAININYLLQTLQHFSDDELVFEMDEPLRPIKIHAGQPDEHAAVVMPMAL